MTMTMMKPIQNQKQMCQMKHRLVIAIGVQNANVVRTNTAAVCAAIETLSA